MNAKVVSIPTLVVGLLDGWYGYLRSIRVMNLLISGGDAAQESYGHPLEPRKPCTEFACRHTLHSLLLPCADPYIISPFAGKVHQERLSPRQSREITPIMRATAIFIFSSRTHPPNPTFCLNITSICPRGKDRPSQRERSSPSAFPAFSSQPRNFELLLPLTKDHSRYADGIASFI